MISQCKEEKNLKKAALLKKVLIGVQTWNQTLCLLTSLEN